MMQDDPNGLVWLPALQTGPGGPYGRGGGRSGGPAPGGPKPGTGVPGRRLGSDGPYVCTHGSLQPSTLVYPGRPLDMQGKSHAHSPQPVFRV